VRMGGGWNWLRIVSNSGKSISDAETLDPAATLVTKHSKSHYLVQSVYD
jgi:hypothetical protein